MPKKNVRVDLHRHSPEKFLKLNGRIIKRHLALGANSPLNQLDMAMVQAKVTEAIQLRNEAQDLHAKAEALNHKARTLLGLDKNQSSYTKGTVYFELVRIRNLLLLTHQNEEETLSTYGFNVVIRLSKARKKKKKEQDNKQGDQAAE